jgi:glycine cleavage system pyridoxal-binding protein P
VNQHHPVSAVFADRHLGPRGRETAAMLDQLGYVTVDALVEAAVPKSIRTERPLDLPAARSEAEVLAHLRDIAGRNQVKRQMIGQGFYDTHTPAVIRRNVLESPAWYTAYTPYQPEISQGRLEALLNFQTMVADLTGLPVANASLLDEATAAAEAMTMFLSLREKEEAKRIYEEERARGHVASLMTQERDNIFTQSVANIEPGKQIDVSVRYFHRKTKSRLGMRSPASSLTAYWPSGTLPSRIEVRKLFG